MSGTDLLLDTNILIYLFSGNQNIVNLLNQKTLAISIVSEIEVLSYRDLSTAEAQKIREFFRQIEIIPLTEEVRIYQFN